MKEAVALSFADILAALCGKAIVAANLFPAPAYPQEFLPDTPYKLEFGSTWFVINRGQQEAPLTFQEAQAGTAEIKGDRLTMQDAQGFMFDLDLQPERDAKDQGQPHFCDKSLEAACSAIGAHQQSLLIEGDPSIQLWHLLASLHEWCAVYGVDFDQELKEFKESFEAGELDLPAAWRNLNEQRQAAMEQKRLR